jgi:hypothetical protein
MSDNTSAIIFDRDVKKIKLFQVILPKVLLFTAICYVVAFAINGILKAVLIAAPIVVFILLYRYFKPTEFYIKIKDEKYSEVVNSHWITRWLCGR